jgi:glycosyltransferase involved in cell wall biosynthesis
VSHPQRIPISVLIPTRNEARNLPRCLAPLVGWADEIVVVDSQSTDASSDLAESCGARVLQFRYAGGWPKKRQWALDTYSWQNEWVLLLDADEILTDALKDEIEEAIRDPRYDVLAQVSSGVPRNNASFRRYGAL